MINHKKTKETLKFCFYIGSNNTTKKTEINKAVKVLSEMKIKGYTINKNLLGFWDNQKEKSFCIEIIQTQENPFSFKQAETLKAKLETDLKQFLVLTEIKPVFVIA